ncbi:hypothetical protein CIL03_18745 [Virgibacillus indicus]|uniref:DUF4825 domain-containing protein n=1 Tax=Virgibacillus indicus TaxID=2024554 RepID=A0A265N6V0_9BACI|nr:hypothetical protein [Virgibacillus indicus]OZU87066.1 hypothetical protein CIL03_18745 [Virgibacillus indicus]
MNKQFIFPILLFVFLLSACTSEDELSGQTFDVAYIPGPVSQEDFDNPNRYDSIMTLEFLDGKVITNSIDYKKGTYELIDDELIVHFESDNEYLKIEFKVNESDKDFSKYSATIHNAEYEITDTEQISRFKNLTNRLIKDMPIEFLREESL